MSKYINTNIEKSLKLQNSIEENLSHAKDLIWKLRELLNGGTPQTLQTSNTEVVNRIWTHTLADCMLAVSGAQVLIVAKSVLANRGTVHGINA